MRNIFPLLFFPYSELTIERDTKQRAWAYTETDRKSPSPNHVGSHSPFDSYFDSLIDTFEREYQDMD
jgi:hypothetical protein